MTHQKATALKRGIKLDQAQPRLDIHLNIRQCEMINTLLATGVWGNTASAVAMRLFDSALQQQFKITPNENKPS